MRRTVAVLTTIAAVAAGSGAPAQPAPQAQAPPSASAAQLSDILKGNLIFLRGLAGVTEVATLPDGTVVAARTPASSR